VSRVLGEEQLYIFVDVTGHCFEDFQRQGKNELERNYNDTVGRWLRSGRKFSVGDMLAFRDDLTDAGFRWSKDFYIKKVGELNR